MSEILKGVNGAVCQMDDTLVHGATEEEHDQRLEKTLTRLADIGVTLNPEKCQFKVRSVKFLGHVISEGLRPG